jgi:PAS domain S-box-containing protein
MLFLHVEDNTQDAELVSLLLQRRWPGCHVQRVDTRPAFLDAVRRLAPQLILSDFSLPSFDGLSALKLARDERPEVPFLFLSGTIGEEMAVEALRNGAIDYVLKDRMGRLVPAIERALHQSEEQRRRRDAESALRETQERYRQITENVADLIAVLDPNGRRIYNNPAYRLILGEDAHLEGTDAFTEIFPEDRERVRQIFQETVRTGTGQRTEYRLIAKDGSVRYIESQGSVIRDGSGRVVNVLVVSRDVTARKQAETRIREQASLLDKARDAICVVDLKHLITYWNASAETLFDWNAKDVLGRAIEYFLFQQNTEQAKQAFAQVLAQGSWEGEIATETRNKHAIMLESRWTLVKNERGEPQSILLISTDITERKRLETQFLRAQRMESIGTLAGGIAHDLNNVLTPILVAAQVLQADANPNDRGMLETIEKSALHGAALIKQVLLFARGAEGEHSPLQPKHLIAEMEKLLRETLPRKIEIRTNVERDLWLVRGDSTQLNQVLMNLCVNARDAMPDGGVLEVGAYNTTVKPEFLAMHPEVKATQCVVLTVADTGTGIPPELLERIWDPFFTTKEIGKGTGLGLSTVLGIVKGHGGAVNVSSREGGGTRFEVFLPALLTENDQPAPPQRTPLPRGNGEGILVVDDEPYIREVIGSMLRYCNFRGFFGANGHEGVALYQENSDKISLALVDMMMPGLDGEGTMRMLRKLNPSIKLVAMSGMLENAAITPGSELEGVELLRKPIAAETLMKTIVKTLHA